MKLNPGLSSDEARELILANGLAVGKNLNRTDIEKVLCI